MKRQCHIPTIAEATERLTYLQRNGESEFAFTFTRIFPAPGMTSLDRPAAFSVDEANR